MIKRPTRELVLALIGCALMIYGTAHITIAVGNEMRLRHLKAFAERLDQATASTSCDAVNTPLQNFRAGDLWAVCGRQKTLLLHEKLRCIQDIVLFDRGSSHVRDEDPCAYRDGLVKDRLEEHALRQ